MNADNRNLIAAIALSMLILIVYQIYFVPPEQPQQNVASPKKRWRPQLQVRAAHLALLRRLKQRRSPHRVLISPLLHLAAACRLPAVALMTCGFAIWRS